MEENTSAPSHKTQPTTSTPEKTPPPEKDISFKDITKDLTPLINNKFTRPSGSLLPKPQPQPPIVQKAHKHLKSIVEQGQHFTIENIPEYMEGTGYDVFPDIAKRLHRGDFAIQAHIDLHGLDREQAKAIFDNFLQESINFDKRMLLVIHGRGLSSPGKPVLKNHVGRWLTRGPWRKWILAFSSARAVDGGSGATYVLLRRKPVTKIQRKGKRIRLQQEF